MGPVWLALIFFGRESVVAFYRLRLALEGIKLKARTSGKGKTVSQGVAQIATIVFFSLAGFDVMSEQVSYWLAFSFVGVSACITVYSFRDYNRHYREAIGK
jgi:phosphatidylglycerophosphate synthase